MIALSMMSLPDVTWEDILWQILWQMLPDINSSRYKIVNVTKSIIFKKHQRILGIFLA